MATNQTASKGRGKPGRKPVVSRILGLQEAAELLGLGLEPERLERWLLACPEDFPGASLEAEGWQIPGRALRAWLNPLSLGPVCSVKDVAEWLGVVPSTVLEWLKLRHPVTKEPLLPSIRRMGRVLISVAGVKALPEDVPAWAATGAGSAFFCARKQAGNNGGKKVA